MALVAVFAYVDHSFINWPLAIGIIALSLIHSIVLATLESSIGLIN